MKNSLQLWIHKYNTILIVAIVIMLQMFVAALYMNNKQGMFIDEFYCYAGAHNALLYSQGEPEFRVSTDENWYNTWNSKEDFLRYFEVRGDESILRHSPAELKSKLKTNVLYYILLNVVESLQPDPAQTKWSGFILNSFFFVIHQIVFFLIGKEIFCDKRKAMVPMIIYGFSAGGITLYTYIRFYLMKSLLCLLIAYFHIKLFKWRNIRGIITAFTVSGVAVLLIWSVQPYIVLYAASAVFVFIIICLANRDYKFVLKYLGIGCAGAVAVVLFMPQTMSLLMHYASTDIGMETINNFLRRPREEYWSYFVYYFMKTLSHVAEGVYNVAAILIILAIVGYVQKRRGKIQWRKVEYLTPKAFYMVGVSVCYFLLNCRIQYSQSYRYMSCSYAGFCVGMAVLLVLVLDLCQVQRRGAVICAVVVSGLFFTCSRSYVDEMFPEAYETREQLAQHPEAANVYVIPAEFRRDFYMDTYCMNPGSKIYMLSVWQTDTVDYAFLEEANGAGLFLWLPSYADDYFTKKQIEQFILHSDYKNCKPAFETFQSDVYYLY